MSADQDSSVGKWIIFFIVLFFIFHVGTALFGSFINEWDESELKSADAARIKLKAQLSLQFGEAGKLEQKMGNNICVYIRKESLNKFSFPERKKPISVVGETWCGSVSKIHFPKVYFYDEETGRKLASYSCVFKYTSISKQ
jgi:hypothetical protein